MIRKPKAGLLPLYLKLYDETFPDMRREFEPWLREIEEGLAREGVETVRADIGRIDAEFRQAVDRFEQADVDLVMTLHLAYSLSQEAVDALAAVRCPILMLDTTMDYEFGRNAEPYRILLNHGVHGVQDLACLLRRRDISFEIVAGHIHHSPVLARAAGMAKAAYATRCLNNGRVLRIGPPFAGMGDFAVEDKVLQGTLGFAVEEIRPEALAPAVEAVTEEEIAEEMRRDRERFEADLPDEVHRRSVRVGLGLRRVLDEGGYDAFSLNFSAFDRSDGPTDTVPFLECAKAMARGLGYAGEGDALTAGLVGALGKAFERTTFTEIFCPDWKGGSLFLSHMGEINPEVAAGKALLCEKDFPWTPAQNPAIAACAPAPGPATLVNLAPGPGRSFRLILAPVEVLEDATHPELRRSVRGWIKPRLPLPAFLERYSHLGGTHHSALVMGTHTEALLAFASFAGLDGVVI